jgi:uncharacterized Zn finger protein
MSFEERDNNALVCPYCQARDDDAWELRSEEATIKCWECGKVFRWKRETSVEYITNADCSLNGEEHSFEENDDWTTIDREPNKEFKICNCKKCSEYEVERRDKVEVLK